MLKLCCFYREVIIDENLYKSCRADAKVTINCGRLKTFVLASISPFFNSLAHSVPDP